MCRYLVMGALWWVLAFTAGAQNAEEADPASPPVTLRPRRPVMSDAEYTRIAAELRALYKKPLAEWPKATVDEGVVFEELGPVPKVEHPPENPFSKAKVQLGQMLYFDPRLSDTQEMACASCHDPDLGWADGRTVAFGRRRERLKRNTPSLLNIGHAKSLFWDGRVDSLESQVVAVMANSHEMNGNFTEVPARLQKHAEYRAAFREVFGDEQVTVPRIAQAIACFERMLVTRRNGFDMFLRGDDRLFPDAAVRGLHLFRTEAQCMNCHGGPLLTNGDFHNLGLSYYGRKLQDLGRYEVTGKPEDVGKFKTPSLRNVSRTGPYMHVGLFALEGVLRLYNVGMPTLKRKPEQAQDPLFPTKDRLLRPLGLNAHDLADLKAFLESLAEVPWRLSPPPLPPHE